MSTTNHISFEELAGNFADVLNKVRDEHKAIVVEYATGEKVVIKLLPETKKRSRGKKAHNGGYKYDANKAKAAILKSAGSWSDVDTDALITMLYRAREEGSRSITRP